MRSFTVPFMMVLIMLSVSTNVQAHDPQNYTILLFDDGPTPEGVVPGILVENDSLFVRNHDTRDNVSHRLVVDLDVDGIFTGVDDYSTQWLNSSCDLNETGEKIDENCNVHEIINLAAGNGFLQGNITIKHQIKLDDNITEFDFFVNFGPIFWTLGSILGSFRSHSRFQHAKLCILTAGNVYRSNTLSKHNKFRNKQQTNRPTF